MRKPRVVIAGQVPPPMGGQNVMVAHALESLAYSTTVEVVSLPFFFTRDWGEHRRVGLTKVWELAAVLLRLVRIRLRGRIDCLLFPFGGFWLKIPTMKWSRLYYLVPIQDTLRKES